MHLTQPLHTALRERPQAEAQVIAYSRDDCDTRILLVVGACHASAVGLPGPSRRRRTLAHRGDGSAPDGWVDGPTRVATHPR